MFSQDDVLHLLFKKRRTSECRLEMSESRAVDSIFVLKPQECTTVGSSIHSIAVAKGLQPHPESELWDKATRIPPLTDLLTPRSFA